MMSPAQICGLGSALLGDGPISVGFRTNPLNKRERLCSENYDRVRLELLRDNIWSFAKRRFSCVRSPVVPEFTYEAAFLLPANFERLISVGYREVWHSRAKATYSIEQHPVAVGSLQTTKMILMNHDGDTLPIVYVADVQDSTQFDIHFAKALGCKLFAEIGPALTEEQARVTRCDNAYLNAISDAARVDAMETPPVEREEDDWNLVRI